MLAGWFGSLVLVGSFVCWQTIVPRSLTPDSVLDLYGFVVRRGPFSGGLSSTPIQRSGGTPLGGESPSFKIKLLHNSLIFSNNNSNF